MWTVRTPTIHFFPGAKRCLGDGMGNYSIACETFRRETVLQGTESIPGEGGGLSSIGLRKTLQHGLATLTRERGWLDALGKVGLGVSASQVQPENQPLDSLLKKNYPIECVLSGTLTRERGGRGVLWKVGLGGGGRPVQLHVRPRGFLRRETQGHYLTEYIS